MKDNLDFRHIAAMWAAEKEPFVKRSTMAAYCQILNHHLLPVFGPMTTVDEDAVQLFVIGKLQSGLSHKSVKDMVIVLKMVVRHGARRGLAQFPRWDIRYPAEPAADDPAVLSVAAQRKLLGHVMSNFSFRNLGIMICLHTGMRIGEICALKWRDIDMARGVISVNRTIERVYTRGTGGPRTELVMSTPKTRNSRRDIPMSREIRKMVRPLTAVVNKDFFVLTNAASPTEPRTYRNYFRQLLDSLDIPRVKFHGLRHSFATRCIESRCDYKTVSVLLGHANISTTLNLYVHPDLEQKKRCIDQMLRSLEK